MKKLLLAAVLAFASPALAVEVWLGRIVATTAKNQTNTAVPFTIPKGARIVVSCDVDTYMKFVSATTGAVTTSSYAVQGTFWETFNGSTYQYLSVLPVSAGTANCQVSQVVN